MFNMLMPTRGSLAYNMTMTQEKRGVMECKKNICQYDVYKELSESIDLKECGIFS